MLNPSQRYSLQFRDRAVPAENSWDKRLTNPANGFHSQPGDANPRLAAPAAVELPQNLIQQGYLTAGREFASNGEPHASDV
jgi:hypothetical protein